MASDCLLFPQAKNRAGSIEARTFVQVTDPNTPLSHKTMVIIVSVSGCALLFVVVFVCVKIYNRKVNIDIFFVLCYAIKIASWGLFWLISKYANVGGGRSR